MIKIICKNCGKKFKTYLAEIKKGGGKYCSVKCSHIGKIGKGNPNWKGGIVISESNYVSIYSPYHPNATKDGYVREHRLIMEKYIGRFLADNEVVHHINGITNDNRIENLELLTNPNHTKLHMVGRVVSQETKKKMSKNMKGNKIWLGKKHSKETKEKIKNAITLWHEKRRKEWL